MIKIITMAQAALIIGLLAVSVSFVSCSSETNEEQAAPPQISNKLPVDAIVVEAVDFNHQEVITGTIAPSREVDIVSEVAKKVVSIPFKDGAQVSQGQLLYKLDDADLKAQLKMVEAELKLAQINEQRLSELLKTEAVMQQDYDEAATKLHALEAQKEMTQVQLSKTEIRAPFAGIAGISKVHMGSFVSPNTVLVNLQDNRKVKLRFAVPEEYLNRIRMGDQVTFETEVDPQKYVATITATETGVDTQSRSVLVQAVADNPQGLFRSGLSARVYFSTSLKDAKAITIPTVALIPGAEGYSVFKVENGVAKMSPVKVTNRNETEAVITSGVTTGDTLMVTNILRASDGTPVQIVSANQSN